jgi:hypothetical protein
VIESLRSHDAIFDVCAIDIGHESPVDIARYQQAQADLLVAHLTPDHHPNLVREVRELREEMLKLPPQLLVQAKLTWVLIERVIQVATLYYVQRRPSELGAFAWRVDAKQDGTVAPYETLWSTLVKPYLGSRSLQVPLVMLQGADYTRFDKFSVPLPGRPGESGTDIRAILRDLAFVSSQDEPGIQLVDILTNALTRAFNGNLQLRGWEKLGRLMVRYGPDGFPFRSFSLGAAAGRSVPDPGLDAASRHFMRSMRPLLLTR